MDYMPAELNDMFRSSAAEHDGGITPIPAEAFHVNDADVTGVNRLCVNHPIATFQQPANFSGAIDKLSGRKVYISSSKFVDGPFRQFYAKYTDDPSWKTYSVTSGHDIMIDAPDRLVEILEQVAR